ncbi:E3 ubiquitin-protein ligase RNF43-like [Sinocyclocheilus rhinocerous]|uniref:E3 ubiquitin-protein ligase RNF43-like n=1 Tax=Sinocyclocheilus rhinocerous TaxID=307959 RepID=UPI0007B8E769|nr:PREDICTED: E3 ubiquitin-protein ligase RNF43-like [Sinocyclocheilus rhinocerous]
MRVPVRQLAGLWPLLLMAASQVALGHTGLELAAAVESERSAPRAMIKVSLLKQEPTSRPITLEGVFAGGSAGYAEGKLMQSFLLAFVGPVSLQIMTCLPEDLGRSGTPCSAYGLNGTALHSLHTCTPTPAHSRALTHV